MRLLEKKNVNTPLLNADALLSVALSMAWSSWLSELLCWCVVLCLNLSSWGLTLMKRIENYSCISQARCQLQEGWMKDNLVRINLINIYIYYKVGLPVAWNTRSGSWFPCRAARRIWSKDKARWPLKVHFRCLISHWSTWRAKATSLCWSLQSPLPFANPASSRG